MSTPNDGPKLATVIEWVGKKFLKVGGVTVAGEGDICRDGDIACQYWDKRGLAQARNRINKAAFTKERA